MFSKTCEYAIRALIFIAGNTKSGKRVSIKMIAKGIDSPEHFIAKILQQLGRKNLVQSVKGPNGGFYLNEKTLNISIAEVVSAIDGNKLFEGCGLGLDFCSETNPCPIHHDYKPIKEKISKMLNHTKLNDFQSIDELGFRLNNLVEK